MIRPYVLGEDDINTVQIMYKTFRALDILQYDVQKYQYDFHSIVLQGLLKASDVNQWLVISSIATLTIVTVREPRIF